MAMIAAVFCSCGQPAQNAGSLAVKLTGSDLVKQDRKNRIQVLCRLISSVTWHFKITGRW